MCPTREPGRVSTDGAAESETRVASESAERRIRIIGLVGGLFLLSAAAGAYEIAPAGVIPLIRESLGVGAVGAGWLVSVMYAASVVASVPAGAALDRVSIRRAVAAAALGLLVAGAWGWYAGRAGAYRSLLASRVLGALSYVVLWNAGATVAGQAVAPERRATAVGVFTASAPAGFALGQFGGPLVAAAAGWPAIFPAFAALAGFGVAVFLTATRGRTMGIETGSPTRSEFASVFADRAVWILCALSFTAFALYLFLNSWLPSYLTDELGVSLALSGVLTALFPAVGVVSRTAGGYLSDRLFGGRRRPVAVGAFAAATPAVVGFVATARIAAVAALLVVAGVAVQLAIGLLFSYVAEVVPDAVGTTAVSLLTSGGLLGAFAAPIAAGWLIERAGYRPAFLAAGAVGALGLLLAGRAPEPGTGTEVGAETGAD